VLPPWALWLLSIAAYYYSNKKTGAASLERLRSWIIRELQVLTDEDDVMVLLAVVNSLLQRFSIDSGDFVRELRKYLFGNSTHLCPPSTPL
jgi:hypothetical protein